MILTSQSPAGGAVTDELVRSGPNDSREYVDPFDTSKRYPSVTTVISAATSKPWLRDWAAKLAAEFAVDQLATVQTVLDTSGRDAAINLVKDASKRQRNERADIGKFLHDVVETLVKGGPLLQIPDELEPYIAAFIEWFIAFDITPLATELIVCSTVHNYAGTLDLIVQFHGRAAQIIAAQMQIPLPDSGILTAIVDVKTGANIDPTMSAQLSAYRRADQVWLPLGQKDAMPASDMAFVLHLRTEGYRMLPVDTDGRSFAAFLRCLELWHWQDEKGDRLVGLPILPPLEDGSMPERPIDHVLTPALATQLAGAGKGTCESVAEMTRTDLLKMKGIGPKTVDKIAAAFEEVGLKLADALDDITVVN